jgi:phosphatidylinositol alpha-1,6-mannosyltransferase
MPRILFAGLAAYGAHGGIQRFNRRVVDTIEAMSPAARTLMLADGPEHVLQGNAVLAATRWGAGGSRARFTRRFLAWARQADVLLVGHINLLPFAALYRLIRPKGRVILFAHGVEIWGDPAYRKPRGWEPGGLRFAVDRVAVVSAYSRDLMARAFALPGDRFSLFPNAVDLQPMPEDRAPGGPTVLAVSRLAATEREKHVDKLIRAMPAVLARVPDARLVIVGDGALRAELEALASDLGVAGHVDFRGFVTDAELAEAYARAALFALPSSKEGFGIVYLEAWLRGLPVIASRFGAGAEVVSDGVDGFTVDPADIDRMAEAIAALLSDPAMAARFAAAGREKVEQRYSVGVFTRNLRELVVR